MNEYPQNGAAPQQNPAYGGGGFQDGYSFQRNNEVATKFISAAETLDELVKHSSLSYDEIVDILSVWRKGVKARVPEYVNFAHHLLMASAGADGQAKDYTLTAVIGHYRQQQGLEQRKRSGLLARFARKKESNPMQG